MRCSNKTEKLIADSADMRIEYAFLCTMHELGIKAAIKDPDTFYDRFKTHLRKYTFPRDPDEYVREHICNGQSLTDMIKMAIQNSS